MNTLITPLVALVRKDLRLYFSNRRALLMSIAAPIVIAAFFGSLFGDDAGKGAAIEIVVTDLDRSVVSAAIVAALRGDTTFDVVELPEAEAVALVKAGKRTAAVVLPAGFGEHAPTALFSTKNRPEIVLHYDPSQAMALQVVQGLLAQHTMSSVGTALFSGQTGLIQDVRRQVADSLALSADRRSELLAMFDSIERVQAGNAAEPADGASAASNSGAAAASAGGSSPAAAVLAVPAASATTTPRLTLPYTVRTEEASSRPSVKYNSYAHAFAGMGVQFILFAGIDLGIGLLAMRRLGLWKRLRASPISKALLLGSRIASTAITALVLLVIIFAAAIAFFDVRVEGSWVGMAGVALAFALMTAGFGLLIAALGRTPEATRGLAIFATLVLVMLGGAWVPAFVFPQWLQTVSLFVPTRWAVDGLDAMTWRGLGLQAALAPIGVMLLFALVFALIALMKFDWEE